MHAEVVFKGVLTPSIFDINKDEVLDSKFLQLIYTAPLVPADYLKYELTVTNLRSSLTPFKIYITNDISNLSDVDLVYHGKLHGAVGTDGCSFESNFKHIFPGEIIVIELPDKNSSGKVACRLVIY